MSAHPLALITGASSGIGKELCTAFAKRGYDLAIVARSVSGLTSVAEEIEANYAVNCIKLPADLSVPDAGDQVAKGLAEAAPGLSVDVLINNAGFGMYGDLATQDRARALSQVRLNVLTLTDLTLRFLPDMVTRDRGTIINIASTAAFQPIPGMAIYAATKSYVKSFTEALWAEVQGTNVHVLTVCPGPTQTQFFDTAGATVLGSRRLRTPAQVVAHALRALAAGRISIVDGFANAAVARVGTRIVPTRLMLAVSAAVVGWSRRTRG